MLLFAERVDSGEENRRVEEVEHIFCMLGQEMVRRDWKERKKMEDISAPNLELPKGVGFAIGDSSGESGIKYLVLQVLIFHCIANRSSLLFLFMCIHWQVHYAAPFAGNVRDYSGITLKVAAEEPPNLVSQFDLPNWNSLTCVLKRIVRLT